MIDHGEGVPRVTAQVRLTAPASMSRHLVDRKRKVRWIPLAGPPHPFQRALQWYRSTCRIELVLQAMKFYLKVAVLYIIADE